MLLVGDSVPPDGVHRGSFGPGLRFEARYRDDGSFIDYYFLQFEPPALAPVLDEVLGAGDVFYDVGANIGIYVGWAAKRVGPSGAVHAFEPVPGTRKALERFTKLNALDTVRVLPVAMGASEGSLTLYVLPGASGLTSAVPERRADATEISVPMRTLDTYAAETGRAAPSLVKIDVEGYEFEVIRGGRELLRGAAKPLLLFESRDEHFARAGTSLAQIGDWLDREASYRLYALLPEGLREMPGHDRKPRSSNTLAAHPREHAEVLARLARRRFRRNQSC